MPKHHLEVAPTPSGEAPVPDFCIAWEAEFTLFLYTDLIAFKVVFLQDLTEAVWLAMLGEGCALSMEASPDEAVSILLDS
jgi:hypothetical protein